MRAARVTFTGASGHQLAGRLHRAVGVPRGFAVFAHCFTCSKDLRAAREIAQSLASKGVTTLRFDFTGLGQSEGDFAETTFSHDVGDLVAASRWLSENEGPTTLLVGHSLGGAAVLRAGGQLDRIRAIATIGAPADPTHVVRHFEDDTDLIRREGEAVVQLAGRPFTIKQSFLDDLENHDPSAVCAALRGVSLLFLHSPQDNTVGIDNARALYQAARHPKSFVTLDGADHLLSDPADARYVGGLIASWAERYLDTPEEVDASHGEDVEVIGGPSGYDNLVIARGRHRLPCRRAGEPGRNRHRADAVRAPVGVPRRLYQHDAAHVRRAEGMAPGGGPRPPAPRQGPSEGLRVVRRRRSGAGGPDPPGDRGPRAPRRRSGGSLEGDRRSMPGPPHPARGDRRADVDHEALAKAAARASCGTGSSRATRWR